MFRSGATYPPPTAGAPSRVSTRVEDGPTRLFDGANYEIKNMLLQFDTSGWPQVSGGPIPDDATVTARRLVLDVVYRTDANTRNLVVEDYLRAGTNADYTATPGSGAGTFALAPITSGLTTFNLSGVTINLTGITGLRLSVDGATPTGINIFDFFCYDDPTHQEPRLEVDYTDPSIPAAPAGLIATLTN